MTDAEIQSYLDRGLELASAPLSLDMVRAWNALEDELQGRDVAQLRAAAEAMPHIGAGVILALIQ